MVVDRAQAFLVLASVRQARGDLPGAHALVGWARELIEECTDPGMLPVLLEETGRALGSGPRGRVEAAAPLTERELAVLFRLARRQEVIDGGVDLLRAGCPAGQGSRHGRREQEKERAGQ